MADADGTHRVPLVGEGPPDLAVVEALAWCQLVTRRAGGRMWLEELSPGLAELLELAGLRQELTGQPDPPAPEAAEQAQPPGQEAAGQA